MQPPSPAIFMESLSAQGVQEDRDVFDGLISGLYNYSWSGYLDYHLQSKQDIETIGFFPSVTSKNLIYQPDPKWLNLIGSIRGGDLKISVKDTMFSGSITYKVNGTNPGKDLVDQALDDYPVLKKIICQESGYRQFEASYKEGKGWPLVGIVKKGNELLKIGGVGIMQLYDPGPSPEAVWNWRKNIEEGLALFAKKKEYAAALPIEERNHLNDERTKAGLPVCPPGIPTQLTPEQLERETIRRYNCGREYKWKPRNAPNCAGEWVIDPSCNGAGEDTDYVKKVLECHIS